MTLPIRYSASGPAIGNSDGGDAVPGEGFQLRLDDGLQTTGELVLSATPDVIPGGASAVLRSLADPKPGRRYRFGCKVTISQNSDVTAVYRLTAQVRIDGGSWVTAPDQFDFRQSAITISTATVCLDTVMRLGSALAAPVLADSALLEVQFLAEALGGDGLIQGGSIYSYLIESL